MLALPLLRSPRRSLLLSSTILLQHQKPTTAAKGARTVVRMAGNGGGEEEKVPQKNPSSNPKVAKFQELLSKDPLCGWDECWKGGYTPWDLGKPTPVVMHLLQTDALPKGRVLVPGCGTGHDVVAIAGPERYVVGLEISETAVGKSRELFSSLPNANYFSFLAEDFFSWRPNEMFDLVFDYTFFCAIDPCMRSAWAETIQDVLKPDGELITLIFPIDDYDGGPPYALSLSNYENVLSPLGFKAISVVDNELAIGPRKGREKLGRWKRCSNQSLL